MSNLPVLNNDTDNVIEFNDGISNKIDETKPKVFEFIKFKWKLPIVSIKGLKLSRKEKLLAKENHGA